MNTLTQTLTTREPTERPGTAVLDVGPPRDAHAPRTLERMLSGGVRAGINVGRIIEDAAALGLLDTVTRR